MQWWLMVSVLTLRLQGRRWWLWSLRMHWRIWLLAMRLACFPEGSGDIFSAFDAWMIAKSLAKTQQMDWQPMKERIGWASAQWDC